jgi:RNA polymerase sigma factor (sigma-70 family)
VVSVQDVSQEFARFVDKVEPGLRRALVGTYGPEVGQEVTRDAMAYAWEHWAEVSRLAKPMAYLFRVGQSRSRRYLRPRIVFPAIQVDEVPDVDPRLPAALQRLSQKQRAAVILLHIEGLTERQVAEAVGVSRATVRKHAERGLTKLRDALGVQPSQE